MQRGADHQFLGVGFRREMAVEARENVGEEIGERLGVFLLEGAERGEPGQVARRRGGVVVVAPGGRGEGSAVEDEDAGFGGRRVAHPA